MKMDLILNFYRYPRKNIKFKKIKWAIPKNKLPDRFSAEILLFVNKENNFWNLKQYPKVNGGIVAIILILEILKL